MRHDEPVRTFESDPYAPPSSPVDLPLDPYLQRRYVWAQRALLAVLMTLISLMGYWTLVRMRAGAPLGPVAIAAAYQVGLPATAFYLVLRRRHVGYLLSLTAGSMFVSLVPPFLATWPLVGLGIIGLSILLWALPWYVARGWFGYLFKRPLHLARPSLRPRR
jgi:hypothetical protein